jgi:hypothetical protein
MSKPPTTPKLYEEEIKIEVRPYNGYRNKWAAESSWVAKPYKDWGTGERISCYGKTAAEAVERLKDKLCKVTAREERKHAAHLEWKSGIKETTFSREQDCNPVVPRPKLFERHP